jgi:chitinase
MTGPSIPFVRPWLRLVLAALFVGPVAGCTAGSAGSGAAGEGGVAGATGAAGTSGPAGTSGAGGAAGQSAAAGQNGAAAASGAAGVTGGAGMNGAAGSSGAAGLNGAAGTDAAGSTGVGGGAAGTTGAAGASGAAGADGGAAGAGVTSGLVFGPYKDTSINMNWNTNVISTKVSGAMATFASDLGASGGKTVTLAFATGECGAENWGGVPGADLAAANVPLFTQAGIRYVVSTGGAAGSFTCGSDAGMSTFIDRWASASLVGVDFDIEAGQTPAVIGDLVARIKAAHAKYPHLRFSLTLATLAPSADGATTAASLGAAAPDGFNVYGDETMAAVKATLGFTGAPVRWPASVTVNLMTMDYGTASAGICVVSDGACQMAQSAIQAAYNLRDKWGVPLTSVELTPMIGGNDATTETFTPADADAVARFATGAGLAGVHYWSYDRDVDCAPGYASPTCNSIGGVGAHGYLKRFMAAGLP